jgi:anhydro-N-acetylmuramic acid kinase
MHPEYLALGLMSGTSCDGVTAALVRTPWPPRPGGFRVLAWRSMPYPPALRHELLQIADLPAPHVAFLHHRLGLAFARAAERLLAEAGVDPRRVAVIGSHGHTAWHAPRVAGTFQIGDASIVAERTGIATVADFRSRDVAAGGEGAPLVPFFDWILFRPRRGAAAVQNIGGIANVTVVTPSRDDVSAFDTGPGVMLLDEAVRRITRGRLAFDRGGRIARSGKLDLGAAAGILDHPYFSRRPPKTTGRELFGRAFLDGVTARHPGLRGADLVRTLAFVTAASIAEAYERFVLPRHPLREVILGGGGSRHPVIVEDLRALLRGIPVRTSDAYGVPIEAKEAAAFAVLALATLRGEPGVIAGATGARREAVLGCVYPGQR